MNSLTQLAAQYGTDKLQLGYIEVYDNLFKRIRDDKIKILEIGVAEGSSLKMWNEYFTQGTVYGMDKFFPRYTPTEKEEIVSSLNERNIQIFQGDQHYRKDLRKMIDTCGGDFDIIIDDGSHWNDDIRISLGFLFRYLKPGGFYVIEDCLWGEVKNVQQKWQTPESFEKHKYRVPSINGLRSAWTENKNFNCPLISPDERLYMLENIKSWSCFVQSYGFGDRLRIPDYLVNVIQKK